MHVAGTIPVGSNGVFGLGELHLRGLLSWLAPTQGSQSTSLSSSASSEPGHKNRMKEEEEGANTRVEIGFSSHFSFCKTGKILLVSPVTWTRCLELLGGTALQQHNRAFERRRWTPLTGESFDIRAFMGNKRTTVFLIEPRT